MLDEMEAAGVEIEQVPPAALVQPRRASTTAPTASCWSSTAGSASPAASASPTSGSGNAQDPEHWRDSHFRARGPGGRADAGGVHGQLDQDARARCCTATTTSRSSQPWDDTLRRCSRARRERGEREHAAHVPAVDRRGREERAHRATPTSSPTTLAVDTLVAAQQRGVRVEIIVPGPAYRRRGRAARPRGPAGGRCSRPASRSTSTSRRCTTAR